MPKINNNRSKKLDKLLQDLNIDKAERTAWNNRDELKSQLLSKWEFEFESIENLQFSKDGTIEYEWIKIVVYIRDWKAKPERWDPKFHFYRCTTISEFLGRGAFNGKYIWNKNWEFHVNKIDMSTNKITWEWKIRLAPCKNCLKEFNYKWFVDKDRTEKNEIIKSFDIQKYFDSFQNIVPTPSHTINTLPISQYTTDWKGKSDNYRQYKNRICEGCNKDFKDSKYVLHVHHKDHNAWNNSQRNLQALCEECHKKLHPHMK